MIKPIDISPINTTNKVYLECKNCGVKDMLTFTNRVVNSDKEDDLKELQQEQCPNCSHVLGKD